MLYLNGFDGDLFSNNYEDVSDRLGAVELVVQAAKNSQGSYTWYDSTVGTPSTKIQAIRDVVIDVMQTHPIDLSRVYAIGYSEGAATTYELALMCPDIFAAVVPIAGYNYVTYQPELYDLLTLLPNLQPVHLLALNGKIDDTVYAEFTNQQGVRRGANVGAEEYAQLFASDPTKEEDNKIIEPEKFVVSVGENYSREYKSVEYVWENTVHRRTRYAIPATNSNGESATQNVDIVVAEYGTHSLLADSTGFSRIGKYGTGGLGYLSAAGITNQSMFAGLNIARWLEDHPKIAPPTTVPTKALQSLSTTWTGRKDPGSELYPGYLTVDHTKTPGHPVGQYSFLLHSSVTGYKDEYRVMLDVTDTDATNANDDHYWSENWQILKSGDNRLYLAGVYWGWQMMIRIEFVSGVVDNFVVGWAPSSVPTDPDEALQPSPLASITNFEGENASYLTVTPISE